MHLAFEFARLTGRRFASRFATELLREVGPFLPEHRIGLANLEAAFPEMHPIERERVLSGAWANLARATVDYAFFQDIVAAFDPNLPEDGLFEYAAGHEGLERIYALRDGGKAGIVFGAHLGNWELAAAIGRKLGIAIATVYRPPANPFIAKEIERRRAFVDQLVVSGRGSALRVAAALQNGSHLGVIVDQRIREGVKMPFFGRPAWSNPIVGILARHFECPVHGARVVYLPDGRFLSDFTAALELPRGADGRVDADATNVMVHGIVENWVRETPDQWLWQHDRWHA
jgi:KDO2-lipid IV(A) lauroyltransferase